MSIWPSFSANCWSVPRIKPAGISSHPISSKKVARSFKTVLTGILYPLIRSRIRNTWYHAGVSSDWRCLSWHSVYSVVRYCPMGRGSVRGVVALWCRAVCHSLASGNARMKWLGLVLGVLALALLAFVVGTQAGWFTQARVKKPEAPSVLEAEAPKVEDVPVCYRRNRPKWKMSQHARNAGAQAPAAHLSIS